MKEEPSATPPSVKENVVWHDHAINRDDRQQLNGHKSAVLWFTGLSGSGKSTIAGAAEQALFKHGIRTYLLDGDNVRHGLCKDLGFGDEDRQENIRRVGEVAKLMADAGQITLTAFISPHQKERDAVRELLPEGDFIEVFVDTPFDVCAQRDPKGLVRQSPQGRDQKLYRVGFGLRSAAKSANSLENRPTNCGTIGSNHHRLPAKQRHYPMTDTIIDRNAALNGIRQIAREAGDAIMTIYSRDFEIYEKSDESPLTEADLAAHKIIVAGLAELTPDVPVLSEESAKIDWAERKTWSTYWLVDPLDGTKEFIKKNGEFTVNIALIENHKPTLSVVYAPVLDKLYFADVNGGAWLEYQGKRSNLKVTPRQA